VTTEEKPWRNLPRPWVADIGSGGDPFPLANILVDLHPQDEGNVDRNVEFKTDGKLVVVADVQALPFDDGELDFVWCSHLLEHVEDPVRACEELFRVSPKGMMFVPNVNSEALFQAVKPEISCGHKWLCWTVGFVLFFLRCDTADKEKTKLLLGEMGAWPARGLGNWGAEHRMGWGWGSWPERFDVILYETKESEEQDERAAAN